MASFVVAVPEAMAAAAQDLSGIGTALGQATTVAAGSTTQIAAAAEDEVSAAVSALFGAHGREFQALSAQAASFHDQFVQALVGGGLAYGTTEAASASPLQTLEDDVLAVINAPTQILFNRPLIGNGADGAPGTGQAGQPGGFLIGNGGNGGSGGAGPAAGGPPSAVAAASGQGGARRGPPPRSGGAPGARGGQGGGEQGLGGGGGHPPDRGPRRP
ncbi:PE family protein [Mycobacterium sp. Marseille-P9652]|uniref:PE family protein n=1 Tax=Mycobacterium sp. Marseille-P9652 TaxID=2654950 RepID=UPI0012E8BC27